MTFQSLINSLYGINKCTCVSYELCKASSVRFQHKNINLQNNTIYQTMTSISRLCQFKESVIKGCMGMLIHILKALSTVPP